MKKLWRGVVSGAAADGQTWTCINQVECEFHFAFEALMQRTFTDLTMGKAVFGNPGVGCKGPYDIKKMEIEQVQS